MNYVSYLWLSWQRKAAKSKLSESALNTFLASELPERGKDWRRIEFIAIDLETTGLNPLAHEIASIGWIVIKNGNIQLDSAAHHLVRTKQSVGNSATLHNITDTQVATGLAITPAIELLLKACTGRVPLFHNARLDMGFLNNACLRYFNSQFITPFVDTLQLEKEKVMLQTNMISPGSLRLQTCRQRYGLPVSPAHNALEDALATAELFIAWATHQAGNETLCWDDIV